jgi:hypothetical protein
MVERAARVACIIKNLTAFSILVGNPEGNRLSEKFRPDMRRNYYNITRQQQNV